MQPRLPPRGPTTTNNTINESAPETGALPSIEPKGLRSLGFDHLRLAVADRDLARLLRLGNLTHEIDVQESVLEARAPHLDVVGELEDALERARRDALLDQLVAALPVLRVFLVSD